MNWLISKGDLSTSGHASGTVDLSETGTSGTGDLSTSGHANVDVEGMIISNQEISDDIPLPDQPRDDNQIIENQGQN